MADCSPEKKKPAGICFRRVANALGSENRLIDHEAHTPPDARIRCMRIRFVVAMVMVQPTNMTRAV